MIEFAIVGPVFLMLIIGLFYTCLLIFKEGSMQYAVQQAARCASVQTTVCTDSSSTVTTAQNAYYGPSNTPSFVSSTATCGHRVTASSTFSYDFVVTTMDVPLNASSCFP
jgi:Flp pilus assembly protein TadG